MVVHTMTRLSNSRQKHYVKPGVLRDLLSPGLDNEQPSSPRHSSQETTPINIVQRLTLKSLKGYGSLMKSTNLKEQQASTVRAVGRVREGGGVREEGGRVALSKEEPVGKESLYTFYTNDEDLVTKGKKMYSSATLGDRDLHVSHPSRRRPLWDPGNIDTRRSRVKDPRVVSEVYRELILHPNHCYESEVVQQWMLERCGPDPSRSRDRDGHGAGSVGAARAYDRNGRGITDYTGGRDAALGYTWPLHFARGRGTHEEEKEEHYYRYYKLATATSSQPQMLYDPLCTEEEGRGRAERHTGSGVCKVHHSTHHRPLYEWSHVYPVVKKPEEDLMVVDRSRRGFQSKPHPLPPIDAASSAGHMTHTHGHHVRIVRIKLPKLQV